jgi:hypothetical protein
MSTSYICLAIVLGMFSVFSLPTFSKYPISFWIKTVLLWMVLFIWGISSTAIWVACPDYLPAKGVALSVLTINLGRMF